MSPWPKQSECDAFYGNPRGSTSDWNRDWYRKNIVTVPVPFSMHMGDQRIAKISVHKKCAASLTRVLAAIWARAGHDPKTIALWGADVFSGSMAYRPMRGRRQLSMHAYGCALDFDGTHNELGDAHGHFTPHSVLVEEFKREGWVWGGDWQGRPDPMHVQAARV